MRHPKIHALVESPRFTLLSTLVIVASAVVLGVETYPGMKGPVTAAINKVCLAFFLVELVLRFVGRASTRDYLRDGWNWFDVIVVAASFVPAAGESAVIVRILRVLRVFRLARTIPELRVIVTVLLKSVVSMKYVGLLALICFYVFAIIGVKLFGQAQAEFSSLHESLFTLFRILTGDNWSDLRYNLRGDGAEPPEIFWVGTAYHVLWIAIATFILVNLIVGAIINNYQEVQAAEKHRIHKTPSQLDEIDQRIEELAGEMLNIKASR